MVYGKSVITKPVGALSDDSSIGYDHTASIDPLASRHQWLLSGDLYGGFLGGPGRWRLSGSSIQTEAVFLSFKYQHVHTVPLSSMLKLLNRCISFKIPLKKVVDLKRVGENENSITPDICINEHDVSIISHVFYCLSFSPFHFGIFLTCNDTLIFF